MTPELPRPIPARDIGSAVRRHAIEAGADERRALAGRFDLLALDTMTAAFDVTREAGGIRIAGRIAASGSQACVASGEPVPFVHDEPVSLLLLETLPDASEIELGAADLDSEPLLGDTVDLGEIAAQALGLALDPYPRAAVVGIAIPVGFGDVPASLLVPGTVGSAVAGAIAAALARSRRR